MISYVLRYMIHNLKQKQQRHIYIEMTHCDSLIGFSHDLTLILLRSNRV